MQIRNIKSGTYELFTFSFLALNSLNTEFKLISS